MSKKTQPSNRQLYRAEYAAINNAINRCHNPDNLNYYNYGARGIEVHPEWIKDRKAFFDHVGPKPDPKLTLDRIDNSKGYVPGNVEWASRKRQVHNTRPRKAYTSIKDDVVTHNGTTQTLKEWAATLGVKFSTIRQRYHAGLPTAELLAPRQRANCKMISHNGRTQSVWSWSEELNLGYEWIMMQLKRGYTLQQIIDGIDRKRTWGLRLLYNGELRTVKEISELIGISDAALRSRIEKHGTDYPGLFAPPYANGRGHSLDQQPSNPGPTIH